MSDWIGMLASLAAMHIHSSKFAKQIQDKKVETQPSRWHNTTATLSSSRQQWYLLQQNVIHCSVAHSDFGSLWLRIERSSLKVFPQHFAGASIRPFYVAITPNARTHKQLKALDNLHLIVFSICTFVCSFRWILLYECPTSSAQCFCHFWLLVRIHNSLASAAFRSSYAFHFLTIFPQRHILLPADGWERRERRVLNNTFVTSHKRCKFFVRWFFFQHRYAIALQWNLPRICRIEIKIKEEKNNLRKEVK